MKRKVIGALLLALVVVGVAACDNTSSADDKERRVSNRIQNRYAVAQPLPESQGRSQLRQNLIDIEKSQIETTQTTSFMFNLGIADPINVCPSIGYAIPTTYQLSNPLKTDHAGTNGNTTIGQIEPNGVFTGDSSGTFVICVNGTGDAYAVYWEGFVMTVAGPAAWNAQTHRVELVGKPSAEFSTDKGK